VDEVNAYRFLHYYDIPAAGVVPKVLGILPSINKKKLAALFRDSLVDDVTVTLPASAVVLEYIEEVEPPTEENMSPAMAEEILRGLRLIHNAHVLHHDTELRNILISPRTGKAVWIDFSNADVGMELFQAELERDYVRELLYRKLVLLPFALSNTTVTYA